MRINELKRAIYNAFITNPIDDKTDELIVSCILYDFLRKVVENETSLQNNIKEVASNYLPSFIKSLNSFRESFISYITMRETIESFRKNSFLEFTQDEINAILTLYRDRTQIKKFSSMYFSQYMYKVIDISDYHYKRLSSIHFNLIVPIIKFYKNNYGASDTDMEIVSALEYLENPGKEMLFSINGVDPSRVINDINSFRIPIKKGRDFYDIRTYKNLVRIITN
jgi:hypothetical protein